VLHDREQPSRDSTCERARRFSTCIALFIEDPKRRRELAMYVLPRGLESILPAEPVVHPVLHDREQPSRDSTCERGVDVLSVATLADAT
jgi:hypothetical protein